jgi:carboxylesterase
LTPQDCGIVRRPDGANVAFLLIHGFGADVDEMASLAEALEKRGIASLTVRLAGHGTTPEDLATTTREDWNNSALDALNVVRTWSPQYLFVAGLSMGGLLALQLAAKEKDIDGIVLFSPALKAGGFLGKLVPILKHFMKYRNIDLSYIPLMYDLPRTKYAREPLSAIEQLLRLTGETRKILPQVTIPALILQAGEDKTIDPNSGQIAYDGITSPDKEIHIIQGAEHVITCHPTRKDAFLLVFSFVSRLAK